MFELSFETENAAFDDRRGEIVRILREIADKIERNGLAGGNVFDVNGNKIGKFELTPAGWATVGGDA